MKLSNDKSYSSPSRKRNPSSTSTPSKKKAKRGNSKKLSKNQSKSSNKKVKMAVSCTGKTNNIREPMPEYCYRCVICDIHFISPLECWAHHDGDEHQKRLINFKRTIPVHYELCFYAKPAIAEPFLYFEDRAPKQLSSYPLYTSNAVSLEASSDSTHYTSIDVDWELPLPEPPDNLNPVTSSPPGLLPVDSEPLPQDTEGGCSGATRSKSVVIDSLLDTSGGGEYRQLVYSDVVTNPKFDIEIRCNVCHFITPDLGQFNTHIWSPGHRKQLGKIKAVDNIAYEHVTATVKNWSPQAFRWANKLVLKRGKREISRAVQCALCGGSILPHRKQIREHTQKDRTHLEALAANKTPYTTFVYERKFKL